MSDTCVFDAACLYRNTRITSLSSTGTRLKDLERQRETHVGCTAGMSRYDRVQTRGSAHARGDKSKVWNASGRISVYLWRGTIQWYTFPVARNSQYFHQKHTYNSRLRWQTVQRAVVLYVSSGRIWQRDAPSQLLPFIRALHYSVTESSVTS